MSRLTGCSPGTFPFTYLGLPIGSSMNYTVNWQKVIDNFKARLSTWKANLLSIGGRLTLIKTVLGSVSIYYMSLFKVPESVIKELERYRATFFWGGGVNDRKISWVKWDSVLNERDKGGLGISSLKASNLALLYKWRWRFLNDHDSKWVKVIKSIHGRDGGFGTSDRKPAGNGIWATIVKVVDQMHEKQIMPSGSMVLQVGNGRNVSFWNDIWVG